ncbi:hypothetical protein Dimus_021028 [Dionaea muscipula]
MPSFQSANVDVQPSLSTLRQCDHLVGGGSVSEEVRVASAAREALRSQPTDGLRQPPSSPAVPESGVSPVVPVSSVDGVGGQDDSRGSRSYAQAVQQHSRAPPGMRRGCRMTIDELRPRCLHLAAETGLLSR